MSETRPTIHICDDWISIGLPDWESVIAAQSALSAHAHWSEIVPGIDSIAVQFDPALVAPEDAGKIALKHLTNLTRIAGNSGSTVTIPVCYDAEFAPDRDDIADRLGIAADTLPSWHISQVHRVAMLGFMPGFAYLESTKNTPAIGRLASPRQLVSAGSIGIIGRQSCIYSFDSPGGWPIIGRTPLRLFDPSKKQPALLSAGQDIRFESISKEAFKGWQQETDE
ncbi:5-oxoprolinase subunit B family protein [Parasphingorhabdus sp.]|uniref:5-oxoprolinase subunit B family protein n=1 Tax=Parasphingorhabdus sp. TaxID=2709688 RepID=UPI003C73BAC6